MLTEQTPILEVRNLTVDFRTDRGLFHAVRNVSFSLNPGDSLALIGGSGSGKSVTANAILSLLDEPPAIVRSGEILLSGRNLRTLPERDRRKIYGAEIAVVFQDPAIYLNPVHSIGWQIAETSLLHGVSRKEACERALTLLDQVGIPSPSKRYHDYPHEFSGGQRQRIMIAMAMAMRPAVLIADEPTTALDVTVQAQILDLLRRLQEEYATALLMITHDLGVAADITDRVAVMTAGEIVEQGRLATIFAAPSHGYTRQLLESRKERFNGNGVATAAEPIIQTSGLDVAYGAVQVVHDVSISIAPGEVVCVVGESGSGKSTLAQALLGLLPVRKGSITYRGIELNRMSVAEERKFRRAVQAVFQDPYSSLNPRISLLGILSEGWDIHGNIVPEAEWRSRATELIESVGLAASDLKKYPDEFSGGQRQRIAIARALSLNSELIVCDEAVSSLDMTVQAQIVSLLARLRTDLSVAILFITHDLALTESFADRVVVMRNGRIVEQGTAADVFRAPQENYTKLLIAASPVADPQEQKRRRERFFALSEAMSARLEPGCVGSNADKGGWEN